VENSRRYNFLFLLLKWLGSRAVCFFTVLFALSLTFSLP
jgi:hypothetical protein